MSIPKIIHYCWFGRKAKGKLLEECLDSWKQVLPDYELCEWNEDNYSSDSFFFTTCMAKKKYAFASDYARFDVLKSHGGIYLDTDMLFIKSLNELLSDHCFFGFENEHNFISCGVIGTEKNDPFIAAVKAELDAVKSESFFTGYTIVQIVSAVYYKMKVSQTQLLPKIHPVTYFYPYPYGANGHPKDYVTADTFAIHLWNATWFNDIQRAELLLSQGRKKEAWQLYLRSLIRHPQYIRFIKKYFFKTR